MISERKKAAWRWVDSKSEAESEAESKAMEATKLLVSDYQQKYMYTRTSICGVVVLSFELRGLGSNFARTSTQGLEIIDETELALH